MQSTRSQSKRRRTIAFLFWKLRWIGVVEAMTPASSFRVGPRPADCRGSSPYLVPPGYDETKASSFASTSALNAIQRRRKKYSRARRIRIDQGPEASFELYRKLLVEFPDDVTTATRLAASPHAHATLQNLFVQDDETNGQSFIRDRRALLALRSLLQRSGYTARSVARRLLLGKQAATDGTGSNDSDESSTYLSRFVSTQFAQAPLFVTTAAAGTREGYPWEEGCVETLDLLVALFLVGLAVPAALLDTLLDADLRIALRSLLSDASRSPGGGNDKVLVTCEANPHLVYSLIQIMPIDLSYSPASPSTHSGDRNLWIITDWHPRTLSLTSIRKAGAASGPLREDAVMYIGPDTLALLQHWLDDADSARRRTPGGIEPPKSLLDLCSGSGVQAIVALRANSSLERAVGIDVNPRSVRFGSANAFLNEVEHRFEMVQADLLSDQCFSVDNAPVEDGVSLSSYLLPGGFDLVAANPPFLPVPPSLSGGSRHGLFSDGGRTGEDVLAATVRLASLVLNSGGTLGVVSEFFFDTNLTVIERIRLWWGESPNREVESSVGLLITNVVPLSVEEYSERRSDNIDEYNEWCHHLHTIGVSSVSPGLLFIRKGATNSGVSTADSTLIVHHDLVPKSPMGSIWTPSNPDAISFTRDTIHEHLN